MSVNYGPFLADASDIRYLKFCLPASHDMKRRLSRGGGENKWYVQVPAAETGFVSFQWDKSLWENTMVARYDRYAFQFGNTGDMGPMTIRAEGGTGEEHTAFCDTCSHPVFLILAFKGQSDAFR